MYLEADINTLTIEDVLKIIADNNNFRELNFRMIG